MSETAPGPAPIDQVDDDVELLPQLPLPPAPRRVDHMAHLLQLVPQAQQLERRIHRAARGAIAQGATYTQVAEALGITRSAAWQRYGPR